MATYDFSVFSPDEFQLVVKDVLEKRFRKRLQTFKPGKDGGIDLRYSTQQSKNKYVIQCKRFERNAFSRLLRVLIKDELSKIEKLRPHRYILATSVSMNPQNKDAIVEALAPHIVSAQDVLGFEDICELLDQNPSIVKRHVKLWLMGAPILERLLHADVFNLTEVTVDSIKSEISRLVVHAGFEQARKLLNKRNHVLIVGLPGIGKTTVARMLMAEKLKEGYQPITVSGDVSEAWRVLTEALHDTKKKYVIYYDDFLGQSALREKFAKNEESRLSQLIKKAEGVANLKLIMTTRDYILEQAKSTYERLAHDEPNWAKATVLLEHYTRPIKARILYQHLYFSSLPNQILKALHKDKAYRAIISHNSFNPRVVAALCRQTSANTSTKNFVSSFIEGLNKPERVWGQPFENQLSEQARLVLLVLACFPDGVAGIEDLEEACRSLAIVLGKDWPISGILSYLKETEGTFTAMQYRDQSFMDNDHIRTVEPHNPSVYDFLRGWLRSNPKRAQHIFKSSVFFSQSIELLRMTDEDEKPLIQLSTNNNQMVVNQICDLITTSEATFIFGDKEREPNWSYRLCEVAKTPHFLALSSRYSLMWLQLEKHLKDSESIFSIQISDAIRFWRLVWDCIKSTNDSSQKIQAKKWFDIWMSKISETVRDTDDMRTIAELWVEFSSNFKSNLSSQKISNALSVAFKDALDSLEAHSLEEWEQAKEVDQTLRKQLPNWTSFDQPIERGLSVAQSIRDEEQDSNEESQSSWYKVRAEEDASIDDLFSSITEGRR